MQQSLVPVNGVKTSYVEQGKGRPILLLHGAGFAVDAKSSYAKQLRGLSDRHRVIALDQLHFGNTDYPSDRRYRNRLQRVDHVVGFLEALNLKDVTVLGHSEGAFVAAAATLARPELVRGMVLLTSGGLSPPFGDDRDRQWIEASKQTYDYTGAMPSEDEFIRGRRAGSRGFDAEIESLAREAYRTAVANNQYEIFANLPDEETNYGKYVQLQQKHVLPRISQIKCPTLMIWSKNDGTVPVRRGVMLSEMIPQADFHVLSGCRHSLHIERPDDVNALVARWLQQLP